MTDKRLQEIAENTAHLLFDVARYVSKQEQISIILSALQRVREEEEQEKQKPLGLPEEPTDSVKRKPRKAPSVSDLPESDSASGVSDNKSPKSLVLSGKERERE